MSVALDRTRAGRMAGIDPALPGLADALQVALLRDGWRLHDVRWTPGERCRLAFAVGSPPATFVAVDVTAEGWVEHDYREDAALRGLADATDPTRVIPLLTPLLDHPPESCALAAVRYRPGSRCVLGYRLAYRRAGGAPSEVFAKVLAERQPWLVDAWRRLSQPEAGSASVVPRLLGEWHDHNVLLAAPVHGLAVSQVLADPALSGRQRAGVARELGRLLSRLHARREVDAPPRTVEDQLVSLSALVRVVRHVDAGTAGRLAAVVGELGEQRPEPGPAVLAHGGFRAGQAVRRADGDLVVLDVDGLHHGDAGRDVATALAHFTWHAIRHPAHAAAMRTAAEAFLTGYQDAAGPLPPGSLTWWRAAALAQLAGRRYRRLDEADWARVPAVVDAAEAVLRDHRSVPRTRPTPPLIDAVRAAVQRVAPLPGAVKVELSELLGAPTARRAVHQYVVRGLDGPHPVTVLAKSFSEAGRAELVDEHLRVLGAGPFAGDELRVPAPVAVVPAQQVVVFRLDDGVPLDRLPGADAARAGVVLAARWLATLHRSEVSLPRRMDLAREVATTSGWATVIGEHHPELLEPARRLAGRWRDRTGGDEANWTPIHKDFHAGHVLVGDGVCVIDLDEARIGAPALDVAQFLACLQVTRPRDEAATLCDAFLVAYEAAGGPAAQPVPGFLAYTWLKLAKQWATGRAHGHAADPTRRRLGAAEALERGWACLGE